MALSLSTTRATGVRAPAAPHRHVRLAPPPRFALGDALRDVADGFVKIFSKPEDAKLPPTGNTGFTGRASHHSDASKPFKDGFQGKASAAAGQEQQEAAAGQSSSYLAEAVERVVGHNFTGDETEPPAGAGSAGWKGDIHDRKSDGFHNRK